MKPSEIAATALDIIATLEADMAAGTIPTNTKSLSELNTDTYLKGVTDTAAVTRFINVWLGAKK